MECPKCMRSEFVSPSGNSHYVCIKDSDKTYEETGCGVQFHLEQDKEVKFPYNVIFRDRGAHEFFRKPYLELTPLGEDL